MGPLSPGLGPSFGKSNGRKRPGCSRRAQDPWRLSSTRRATLCWMLRARCCARARRCATISLAMASQLARCPALVVVASCHHALAWRIGGRLSSWCRAIQPRFESHRQVNLHALRNVWLATGQDQWGHYQGQPSPLWDFAKFTHRIIWADGSKGPASLKVSNYAFGPDARLDSWVLLERS